MNSKSIINKLCLLFLLFIPVSSFATITKTIGATGDYASITAAWAAIPGIESPITQPWIFELKSDYNIASETFPVNLTAISGASATNTITIRPQSGVTALSITDGAATSIIQFNGADYVILDGRPGGAGTSELTIENTQTASLRFAIKITADAIYNTIKYCTLKGSSYNSAQIQNACVVSIDEGNQTTNCDNTTITNCTITKSGVNKPSSLIGIGRNTVAINLDNLTISNNNLVDFDQAAIYSPWSVVTPSITGNSIYQTATWGDLAATSYGIYMVNASNGSMTITGNYIGGQAANCGGATMAITSATNGYYFTGIRISSNGGTVTISANTLQNITITQSTTGSTSCGFDGIEVSGTSNYTIGSSGNGNVIGAAAGTGSIVVAGAVQAVFYGIYDSGTGTNSIAYNTIGAISVTATSGIFDGITVSSTGTHTMDNNTIGNATASNISNTANATSRAIYMTSTGTYNVTNNTIQNFSLTGGSTSTVFYLVYISANGTLTATGNTIKDLASNGVSTNHYIFRVTSTGTSIVSSNTIGSTSANNIVLSGATPQLRPIGLDASGTLTCNNNTIQQLHLSSATSSNFYAIFLQHAGTTGVVNADGNVIKNITQAGTGSCYGVFIAEIGAHVITNNTIQDITSASGFTGIDIRSTTSYSITGNTIGSTTANNMSCTSTGSNTGISVTGSGATITVTNNTIQQFNITNTNSSFLGIYATSGILSASGNTIKNITSVGNSTASYGIRVTDNVAHAVSTNTLQDLTFAYTFYGIYIATGTGTFNGNTLGSSTANNITCSGNIVSIGIYVVAGSSTVSNNTIQNWNLTNTGTSNKFAGIQSAGTATISGNTISTITSASTSTTSTAALMALNGIYLSSISNSVTNNTISTLTITSSGASAYCVSGIYSYINSAGINTMTKNKITGLGSAGTSASTIVVGFFIEGTGLGVNAYNNIILLDNGASSGNSIVLNGIRNTGSGTSVIYHNTVKIYGTATSNSGSSSAYRNGVANTTDLRNNIFQNVRTNSGGTGKHYAYNYNTNPTTVTSESYNYIEASGTGGYAGLYGGADQTTLGNWQTASGTGTFNTTASLSINALGKSTNGTTSDIVHTGFDLFATVADDYEATARAQPQPCMGAFECPIELPVELLFFSAKYIQNSGTVHLNWATISEHNNDFFIVEKTIDGVHYDIIETVEGNGNSYTLKNYETFDIHPSSGLSYYRLKQTDFNGLYSYSDLETIYIDTDKLLMISVYPNPGSIDAIQMKITSRTKKDVKIELFNEFGMLLREDLISDQEQFDYSFNDKLMDYKGVIICKIKSGDEFLTSKIIIK